MIKKNCRLLLAILPLISFVTTASGQTTRRREPLPALPSAPTKDIQDLIFFGETRPLLIRLHIQIAGKPFRASWDEFIKDLFEDVDRNKDGVLNREELERAPGPPYLFSANPILEQGGSVINFQAVDVKPRDGKITVEEFSEFYDRAQGGGMFQVTTTATQGPSAKELNQVLMTRLDANKDGKLSKEELAAAQTSLLKLDLDENEMITAQELGPRAYASAMEGQTFVDVGAMSGGTSLADGAAFFVVTPGDRSANLLLRQLLTRYGPPKSTLRTTMELQRKAVRLDKEVFDRLDDNKDDKLNVAELLKVAGGQPDLELNVRIGQAPKESQSPGLTRYLSGSAPASAQIDIHRESSKLAPLAAATPTRSASEGKEDPSLALRVGVATQPKRGIVTVEWENSRIQFRPGAPGLQDLPMAVMAVRQTVKEQFKMADTDNNGYLEMKEVQSSPVFRRAFKILDADADGKLYEKEISIYQDKFGQLQAKALASRISVTITEGLGLFEVLDKNRDGRLTLRELLEAPKLIEQIDRDSDRRIQEKEIIRTYRLDLSQGSSYLGVTPRPTVSVPQPSSSAGPLWFRKMDRNLDGDVSPREFLGSKEAFEQLDGDKDGLISPAEAKQAVSSRSPRPT